MTPTEKLERLLDLIADALIQSDFVNVSDVTGAQKFILNGQLQAGAGEGVLALFQKDIKANIEDLNTIITLNQGTEEEETIPKLQDVANKIDFSLLGNPPISIVEGGDFGISISINGGGDLVNGENITELVVLDGNFSNTSQFIPLQQSSTIIDTNKANEFLDTNIFELLPSGDARQARIIRFFQELNALLPPTPEFENPVERDNNGNWTGSLDYNQNYSISYTQDNPSLANIDEEDAFIHRLKSTANDTNSSRTIEDIYNTILPYLTDILEDDIGLADDREVYQNKSNGYLKFRNLNSGIIIRNTNQDFIEGLDPNNLTYLDRLDENGETIPGTGFTITMWVRFLDKVSEGTLFNFGNPTREENPFGFKLETYVLNKDDKTYYPTNFDSDNSFQTFGNTVENTIELSEQGIFSNSNTARFVRLMVREEDSEIGIRDSHTGNNSMRKISWNYPDLRYRDGISASMNTRLLNTTFIPEDFNEWYFICASYNPGIIEPRKIDEGGGNPNDIDGNIYTAYEHNKDFWMNHITPNLQTDNSAQTPHQYINNSGFGNKCKVEIISKSDLLRARGFKV
jgi:hypothetical protein